MCSHWLRDPTDTPTRVPGQAGFFVVAKSGLPKYASLASRVLRVTRRRDWRAGCVWKGCDRATLHRLLAPRQHRRVTPPWIAIFAPRSSFASGPLALDALPPCPVALVDGAEQRHAHHCLLNILSAHATRQKSMRLPGILPFPTFYGCCATMVSFPKQ